MNIVITKKDKIEELLNSAQNRCSARTLTYADIVYQLKLVEEHLGISKKLMEGIRVEYTGNEKLPSAYKYSADATQFNALYHSGKWYITWICRGRIDKHSDSKKLIHLTDAAKEKILDKYRRI